ncbi:MAG TPA: helix-turn-helix transcriptional regulator [Terriglobales bacterium]|nr:helix-turn-helix transcriptional regulator [Terriglobales bacterium]
MSIYAGQQLRHLREQLGLTLRDVEAASSEIAAKHSNSEFFLPLSRIFDIETKGMIPSIFRIYSLAAIYHQDHRSICELYGVNFEGMGEDAQIAPIRRTHRFGPVPDWNSLSVPVELDPGFDIRQTMNLGRMIQKWGTVPLQFLTRFSRPGHTYVFLGTEDFTMYPLLLPGSFLQVDEGKTEIMKQGWRSEYERPIYFVETRQEFFCSWCDLSDEEQLILQPHPLSPVKPRVFRWPQEAEVVGQVVGVAMRLDEWRVAHPAAAGKRPSQLN